MGLCQKTTQQKIILPSISQAISARTHRECLASKGACKIFQNGLPV